FRCFVRGLDNEKSVMFVLRDGAEPCNPLQKLTRVSSTDNGAAGYHNIDWGYKKYCGQAGVTAATYAFWYNPDQLKSLIPRISSERFQYFQAKPEVLHPNPST
ncbi:MAG: hypothetical protein ACXW0H_06795, partial [Methylobacter sp.]